MKPVICVDFDGTIASKFGLKSVPNPGAIDALNLYTKHFDVVIFTVRGGKPFACKAIEEWLREKGYTGECHVTNIKVPA